MRQFLIAYSYDLRQYMWQSSQSKTGTILMEQFSNPTIERAEIVIREQNQNASLKNLKVLAISDLGKSS